MSRKLSVRYVGAERWKTPEAAREYREEAQIRFGNQSWLMSDEEARTLAAAITEYLGTREPPRCARCGLVVEDSPQGLIAPAKQGNREYCDATSGFHVAQTDD